jgi:hypothetical protein
MNSGAHVNRWKLVEHMFHSALEFPLSDRGACFRHPTRRPKSWRLSSNERARTIIGRVHVRSAWSFDSDLRVLGAEGLRVADAPVMPSIVRGNTNAAVIAIAEKAEDILLGKLDLRIVARPK